MAEAAVVGAADDMTGQGILAFVIPCGSANDSWEQLIVELKCHVAREIGRISKLPEAVDTDLYSPAAGPPDRNCASRHTTADEGVVQLCPDQIGVASTNINDRAWTSPVSLDPRSRRAGPTIAVRRHTVGDDCADHVTYLAVNWNCTPDGLASEHARTQPST